MWPGQQRPGRPEPSRHSHSQPPRCRLTPCPRRRGPPTPARRRHSVSGLEAADSPRREPAARTDRRCRPNSAEARGAALRIRRTGSSPHTLPLRGMITGSPPSRTGGRPLSLRRGGGARAPPDQILLDEVVPVAATADLHDIDRHLANAGREPDQLRPGSGLPLRLLEFLAIDVVDEEKVFPPADGASLVGSLTVKPRGREQIRRGVADLIGPNAAGIDLAQQRPPLKRVVDDLALRTHG